MRDEASHQLYFRPLDEVLDRALFGKPHDELAFELVSSDGTVLESHPVYEEMICVDPGGCYTEWSAAFEHPPGNATFRFVEGSRIVYTKRRSPNAPEVSFLGLSQGQVFAGDADAVFQLLIDDKDDDDLTARIRISVDGGPYESVQGDLQAIDPWDLTAEGYGSPITITSGVNVPGVARMVPAGSQSVRLLVAPRRHSAPDRKKTRGYGCQDVQHRHFKCAALLQERPFAELRELCEGASSSD